MNFQIVFVALGFPVEFPKNLLFFKWKFKIPGCP